MVRRKSIELVSAVRDVQKECCFTMLSTVTVKLLP